MSLKSTIIICSLAVGIVTLFCTFSYLLTTVKPKPKSSYRFYIEEHSLEPAVDPLIRHYQIRRPKMNASDKLAKNNCSTIQVKILDETGDPKVEIVLGHHPPGNKTEQKLSDQLQPTTIYFPQNNTEINRYFPNETIISLNSSLWVRINELDVHNFIDIKMKATTEKPVLLIDSAESLYKYFKYKDREDINAKKIKSKDVSDVIEDLDKVAELVKKGGNNNSYFYKTEKQFEENDTKVMIESDFDLLQDVVCKNQSNKEVNHTLVLAEILNTIWDVTEILRWNQNNSERKNIARRRKYLRKHAKNDGYTTNNITTNLKEERNKTVFSESQLNYTTTESVITILKNNKSLIEAIPYFSRSNDYKNKLDENNNITMFVKLENTSDLLNDSTNEYHTSEPNNILKNEGDFSKAFNMSLTENEIDVNLIDGPSNNGETIDTKTDLS